MKDSLKFFFHSILFFGLLFLDLFSKFLATNSSSFFSWLNFETVKYKLEFNKGIACGMLSNLGECNSNYLIALTLVFLIFFAVYALMQYQKSFFIFGEIAILAGGLGNIISRMMYGGVVDFIHLNIFTFLGSTTINLADVFISFGIFLLIIKQINNDELKN